MKKILLLLFFINLCTVVHAQYTYNGSSKHTFNTNYGSIEIGPFNTSWAHIYTDRPKIIFNKDIYTTTNSFSSYDNDLILKTKGTERLRINDNTGYVGIGTAAPEYGLHVQSGVKLKKTSIGVTISNGDNSYIRDEWLTGNYGPAKWDNSLKKWVRPSGTYNDIGGIVYQDEGTYFLRKSGGGQLEFTNAEFLNTSFLFAHIFTGNIGIGTNTPDSKLTVKGNIHAEEVKVDLSVPGPDYVFKEDYDLKSLVEVQNYIQQNGHLPNIPSANEMEANGIQLGEMNMKLLEKIEELTLYVILQEKELKDKDSKIYAIEEQLVSQQKAINEIIKNLKK